MRLCPCGKPTPNRDSKWCHACRKKNKNGPKNPDTDHLTPTERKIYQSGYNAGYRAARAKIQKLEYEIRDAHRSRYMPPA